MIRRFSEPLPQETRSTKAFEIRFEGVKALWAECSATSGVWSSFSDYSFTHSRSPSAAPFGSELVCSGLWIWSKTRRARHLHFAAVLVGEMPSEA